MDFAKVLNQAQFQAVSTIDKPVLVIAGAGSGKTRVIEYKVLYLIEQGINPENILLLTFTRRAAREMLGRACSHNPRCSQIEGGTFHSFANKILRKFAKNVGLANNFIILDQSDSSEAVGKCAIKLGFNDSKKKFPQKETMAGIISKSLNKGISIQKIMQDEYEYFLETWEEIKNLAQIYQKYKRENNYVDYDDLLLYLRLLLQNLDFRNYLNQKYHYLMVDEFQDTNKLQGDITYLLAKDHQKVMIVGDDAQSIYGFRGANHDNILSFPKQFPDCQIIKLEQNYRSTQKILDLGNTALSNMQKKFEKELKSSSHDHGTKPKLLLFKNAQDEAEWICQKIIQLKEEGVDYYKQAVLFRNAYISIAVQAELSKYNIPFQMFGGMKFYETAHVKDLLSYLKILVNFKDELSWSRVLQLLPKIGPKSADKITDLINQTATLAEALEILQASDYKFELRKLIKVLQEINDHDLSVGETMQAMIAYYKNIIKTKFDDWQLRLSDLESLVIVAENYRSLSSLLADFALEPPQQGVAGFEDGKSDDQKPITLSTIHSAKGLEWEVVFLIGMIEGVLPSKFSLKNSEQLEEEHRLFYVAITRAKKYLFLTMHHVGRNAGIFQFNRLSRFVENSSILRKLEQEYIGQENNFNDFDVMQDLPF
ncbi:ATP-dependent helicase [Candidatus Beckwithbacteria bacterium]|nr:ATP-dependent helicase [Candidatus Beckwithbacteria bacterium]